MDLGVFRFEQARFAGRAAARLDYGVLVATLQAMQSAGAVRAEVSAAAAGAAPGAAQDPLVELILGGSSWREAIVAQGGCFNAALAGRRGKTL
jgi:hypothetical protein